LGILSSSVHTVWALATGGKVGPTPTWTNTTCFEPFPFPADVAETVKRCVRVEAEALDALRKRVLTEQNDLTLTNLYNVLHALRAGRTLTPLERDVHDRGLVTLIRQHHDKIDQLVAEAYRWPQDLSDTDVLARLVSLNKERAAEEARGLIRYLRPSYQNPRYAAPFNALLDLGEATPLVHDNTISWPARLPQQVKALQQILAAAARPLSATEIARQFKGKRSATVRPVLDALAALGQARALDDGRYAS
jgi:hypothetical protein